MLHKTAEILNLYLGLEIMEQMNMYAGLQLLQLQRKRNERVQRVIRARRTIWVKNWVCRREQHQPLMTMFRELRVEDPDNFRRFIRMDYDTFHELLQRVGP